MSTVILPMRQLEVETVTVHPDGTGAAIAIKIYEPSEGGPVAVTGPESVYPVHVKLLALEGNGTGGPPDFLHLVLGGDQHWNNEGVTTSTLDGEILIDVVDEPGSSNAIAILVVTLCHAQSLSAAPRVIATPLQISLDLVGSVG